MSKLVITLRAISSRSQGFIQCGAEVSVPEEIAKSWVENGLAKY